MEVYVFYHLMSDRAVVLQDVVVLCAQRDGDLFCEWKSVCEVFIRDPVEFF